jgi:hypothetical protein
VTTLDERIAAIVRRTLDEQGLSLEVRDPVVLHTVAVHILAARSQHNGGPGSSPGRRATASPPHTRKGPVHHATVP